MSVLQFGRYMNALFIVRIYKDGAIFDLQFSSCLIIINH